MTLIYLVVAWSAGIALASSHPAQPLGWLGIATSALASAALLRRNAAQRLALLCAALFALGAARYGWAARPLPQNHISHWVDSGYVTLTGVVSVPPDVRDRSSNLRVDVDAVRQNGAELPAHGLVLVQAPHDGTYAYGDLVRVGGSLLTPPEFDTFSYRDYLARQGVRAQVLNARVEVLAHDTGRPWLSALYNLKARAQRAIDRMLPSPQAPLLSGILLGDESALDEDVKAAFSRTGTSHIIAISGANVVVVVAALTALFAPLGVRRARWLAVGGVAIYAVFVGGNATVVRAAIMGSVSVLAMQSGRKAHGLTTLAFTVWLMSLANPHVLWDVGFQLSVAATLGLILFTDDITRGMRRLLDRVFERDTSRRVTGWLTEPVAVSLAAQITTTPLIVFYFGQLSLISLLANLLIVSVQPYIMLGGWLAVFGALVSHALGTLLGWVVWLPLSYTLRVVRVLAEVDWAAVPLGVSQSEIRLFYGMLAAVAWLRVQHRDDRAALANWARRHVTPLAWVVAGGATAALVWALALTQPDGRLHVWFLDVGDGHAVLIRTPRGASILVDGGDSPTRLRRAVGDALPFWDRDLDLVIATQSKASSVGALPDLLTHYPARAALASAPWLDDVPALRGAQIVPVQAGWRAETADGVSLEVLHPQAPAALDADPEDAALVLRVSYGDASFLLAPDVSDDVPSEIVQAGWYVGSTVLELPSQGGAAANSEAFLSAARPQVAVVSVAAGARSNRPAPETLARLNAHGAIPLFRTDDQGTVEMETDGRMLWVYTAR